MWPRRCVYFCTNRALFDHSYNWLWEKARGARVDINKWSGMRKIWNDERIQKISLNQTAKYWTVYRFVWDLKLTKTSLVIFVWLTLQIAKLHLLTKLFELNSVKIDCSSIYHVLYIALSIVNAIVQQKFTAKCFSCAMGCSVYTQIQISIFYMQVNYHSRIISPSIFLAPSYVIGWKRTLVFSVDRRLPLTPANGRYGKLLKL